MDKSKNINGNVESMIRRQLETHWDSIMENEHTNVRIQRIINALNNIDEFGVCSFSEICKYRK
jgi:hypothetical protein